MNIQHYDRINRFEDTLQGSNYVLLSSGVVNGRTVRKYELTVQANSALKSTVDTIRNLLARNPFLCPTFLLASAHEILREKPYLTINGEAVCLSEEKDTSDVPAQFIDHYFSQDILQAPIRCPRGHLLEGSAALLWSQTKQHCPGEGPSHVVEEYGEKRIISRVLTDYKRARTAKLGARNVFDEHLQSSYEIYLFAKLYHPAADVSIVSQSPTKVCLTIDQQTIDFRTHVRRDAFATALRIKRFDLQSFSIPHTMLQDEPSLEMIKRAFLLSTPVAVVPALNSINSFNPIRYVLDLLLGRVDESIQKAIDAGNHALLALILTASTEVKRAIDHFAITYKDLLDLTVDKVSVEVQHAFNQLVSIVDHFESLTTQGLNDATRLAQQLINSMLPFYPDNQLTTVEPVCFVVKDSSQKSIVAFKGNFPWIGKDTPPWGYLVYYGFLFKGQSFDPKLRLNDIDCELLESGTQEVKFRFPNNVFKPASDNSKFSMATGTISFPYTEGWLWRTLKVSEFHRTFLALPQIAGKMNATFRQTLIVNGEKRMPKDFPLGGSGNQNSGPIWKIFEPDFGYLFDLKTIRRDERGDGYYIDSYLEQRNAIAITVCFNKPGSFEMTIFCDQVKTEANEQFVYRQEASELLWNEQMALRPRDQEEVYSFDFEDCRGRKDTFSPPCTSKGILKIAITANGIFLLTAEIPKDLKDIYD